MAHHELTRRAFIATTAVVGLAATRAECRMLPPLRAVVIGCGAGGRRVLDAMALSGGALSPHAVIDSGHDWRAHVQRADLEAVFIATPDHLHAEMAAEALQAGKHVYVLPPFTRTGEEARKLEALARKHDRVLQVGAAPEEEARWAHAGAAQSQTGEPLWIQVTTCGESLGDLRWQRDRECSHGPAARQIFNMLYPLQFHLGLGAPERATALGGVFQGRPEASPDRVLMTLRYGGGATVVLDCAGDRNDRNNPPIMRGILDSVDLPLGSESGGLDADLKRFAAAIAGERQSAEDRLRAACIAQEAVSAAMERWAHWESNGSYGSDGSDRSV